MIHKLDHYKSIAGEKEISGIIERARPLRGKTVGLINSTAIGGGVAEILYSMTALLNDVGVRAEWKLLKAKNEFFEITKTIHNGLLGNKLNLTAKQKMQYMEALQFNSLANNFDCYDLVIVHDPQPLGLIEFCPEKKQPWLFRSHINFTEAYAPFWKFVEPMIRKYDGYIVSSPEFITKGLGIPGFVIMPAIDPLTPKNLDLSEKQVDDNLKEHGIDPEIPIVAQVSRFDRSKGHPGVVKIFKRVQDMVAGNLQLVLMGDMAVDDPEGKEELEKIRKLTNGEKTIKVVKGNDHYFVNALQRKAKVIFQNSFREGFCLTVTEAMWKSTPVVARDIAGIATQIRNGKNGYLYEDEKQGAEMCARLLNDKELRENIGRAGRERVERDFLITRQLRDYLNLFREFMA